MIYLIAILIVLISVRQLTRSDYWMNRIVRKMYKDIATSRQEPGEIQQVVLMSRQERKLLAKNNGGRFAPIHQYRGSRDKGWLK